MQTIDNYTPNNGRFLKEDSTTTNIADAFNSFENNALKVTTTNDKWRDFFSGSAVNATKWDVTGSGVSVSSGTLILASGTTINEERFVLSKETFRVPMKLAVGMSLSQRIANQSFFIELVSVNPTTGVVDNLNQAAWVFEGTTATQAIYRVRANGNTALSSNAITITTTASTMITEIEIFADETWFHSGAVDGGAGRAASNRRQVSTPDPNAVYKIRLRWLNGASAPASSTNATVSYISCVENNKINTEMTLARGTSVVGQGIPIRVMPAVDIGSWAVTSGTSSGYLSTATTNATNVKNSSGNLFIIYAVNYSASVRYLKLHNTSSTPTPGSAVVETYVLPATSSQVFSFPPIGARWTTGISFTITGAIAESDTTAIGAGDVRLRFTYI